MNHVYNIEIYFFPDIMMKCYALWILSASILFSLVNGEDMGCLQSDICECYKSLELEYQCPKPPERLKVIMHTIPNKNVKIDCFETIPEYDLDIFPNLDLGDIEFFSMRFCPLPSSSFNTTLEKFNISRIQFMQLEEIRSTDLKTVTVNKQLFYGIPGLEKLELKLFRIKLEEDFLEYVPNLTTLYLDDDKIQEIGVNTFKYVPKLRILHLSRNSISNLPDGVFENLSELQQLHLWKNELTALTNKSFIGLKQLKSLELSNNKISSLDDDTFAELVELVNISLRSNNLQVVTSNIFKHNTALELVRMGNNPELSLSDYVFANLTNLLKVNIDNSNLEDLPEHVFEGCINLTELSLRNNNITKLPEIVFENLTKLKRLFLDGNKIKILPDNIFSSMISLEILDLEGNDLEEINDSVFRKISNLVALNLQNNKIATIHLHAFGALKKLTELDLSYNVYRLLHGDNVEGLNPFADCEVLRSLNLSHNIIDRFPENIMDSKTHLVSLDLSYNGISYIRVSIKKNMNISNTF